MSHLYEEYVSEAASKERKLFHIVSGSKAENTHPV